MCYAWYNSFAMHSIIPMSNIIPDFLLKNLEKRGKSDKKVVKFQKGIDKIKEFAMK